MVRRARKAPRQAEAERNDRALLEAARTVLALDGEHASVAAIARQAGVGIGSLYRRYPTKEALFQHLCEVALDQWLEAAEDGLAHEDPWQGFAHYVTTGIALGPGLGAAAGTIVVTPEMADKNRRSDEAAERIIARAHEAEVLRRDVTAVDVHLLIEQLAKSPLLEQLAKQGRSELLEEALNSRQRITAIVLDGLRATKRSLPGHPPSYALFSERWAPPPEATPPTDGRKKKKKRAR